MIASQVLPMPNAFKTQSQPPAAADASESSSSDTAKAKRLKHVYITTIIYVVVALLQLTIVKVLNFDFSKDVPVPGFVWILVSLVSFLILLCTGAIYLFPVNWTLSVIIIEAITLSGMSRSWHAASLQWVLGAYLIVLLLYIILGLLAIFLPLKLLPGNTFVVTATVLFIIGFTTMLCIVYATKEDKYWIYLYIIFVAFLTLIVLYLMAINYERYPDPLITDDSIIRSTIGAALFLYLIHFVVLIQQYICPPKS